MSKNPNFKSNDDGDDDDDDVDDDDDGDDDETLRRAAAWRDSPGIWRELPLRGGRGGSLSPGRSGIRGPARPFASQSKTQGSPLGGYLSWLTHWKWWFSIVMLVYQRVPSFLMLCHRNPPWPKSSKQSIWSIMKPCYMTNITSKRTTHSEKGRGCLKNKESVKYLPRQGAP